MFFKIGVLKNFKNFTWKRLVLESNFSKVAGLICCNFIKKRLLHRCFPVKFAKFLRTLFFTEHLHWMLLRFSDRPILCELNWYTETLAQVFSCEFSEILKTLLTTSIRCFFLSQDAKHQNTLWQLHAMGSFIDGKSVRQQVSNYYRGVFRT